MKTNLARALVRIALAAGGIALALPSWSQAAFPTKQIRIVVGYPAGQTTDTIARSYAAAMSKDLGQAIFVDNRAGANGTLGAQEVKRAAPDGYTILFATSGQMAINPALYKNLPYNTVADFVPVSLVGSGPEYLVANPAFPPNNVKELIAYAKSQPGKIDYGSGGIGITAHLTMELLQQQAGIKLTHVPYKGSPAAIQDLIAGRVSLMFDAGATVLPYIASGKLKLLGVTSKKRMAQVPNAPTFEEQGMPGFEVNSWAGAFVPAGTPANIVATINAAIKKASIDPAVLEVSRNMGLETAATSSEQFSAFVKSELKTWNKAVVDGNVHVE